jgi:hypothetical protein
MMMMMMMMMMKPAPDPYNYKGTAESRSHYDHNDLPWARTTKYVTETHEGCFPSLNEGTKKKQHGHISVRCLIAFNHHHDDSSTSSIDNIDLSRPLRPYQPSSFKLQVSVVSGHKTAFRHIPVLSCPPELPAVHSHRLS